MAMALRWLRRYSQKPPRSSRVVNTSHVQLINGSRVVEEEGLPNYNIKQFYPVKIGEVLAAKYQVLGKLGFGATSTVWLCRNLKAHNYAVIKLYIHEDTKNSPVNNEIQIYNRLSSVNSEKPGKVAIRTILDHFTIMGPYGLHHCIVHTPLAMSLQWLRRQFPTHKLPESLLKITTREILQALDFLHSDANIIHTDLKASNFLTTVEDETILTKYEAAETETPSLYKVMEGQFIYESRQFERPNEWGSLILTDFGEARVGPQQYKYPIQPQLYRAPEVMLQMNWDYKVDIWNLGVMVWDLLEGRFLFDGDDDEAQYSISRHLAEMVGFFGKPPVTFIQKSKISSQFFNIDGTSKSDGIGPLPSLHEAETLLEGDTKDVFLSFIQAALQWDPERRSSARDLLSHPWLHT